MQISLVICAFIICLFNFDNILIFGEEVGLPKNRYSAIIWAILTAFLMWGASRFAKISKASVIATVAATVMFIVPVIGFIIYKIAYGTSSEIVVAQEDSSGLSSTQFESLRNIYIIVPDSYPRADVMERVYGYDNSEFIDALRARGFKVAERSYANYYTTFLSMSSMFNMDYHNQIIRPEGLTANVLSQLGAFGYNEKKHEIITIGNSVFLNTLKSYGYKYVFSGVFNCDDSMDFCYARSWIFIPDNLLKLTPFELIRSFLRWKFNWDVSIPNILGMPLYLELPEILELRPGPENSPFYMYVHLMMPHSPYRYHADCSEIRETVFIRDAFVRDAVPYFNGQVECLNSQIIEFIDTILFHDPNSDIIIQSDTGTILLNSYRTPISQWTNEQFEETYAILSAVKINAPCMDKLYDSYTPVNLSRIVLSCVDGIDRPLLPDISYLVNNKWELKNGQLVGKVEHTRRH
ncbi:MAG: hypothetical protein CMO98_13405 [Woeseia sp.]|nr:hypothetical protein [Woeseia sp.]